MGGQVLFEYLESHEAARKATGPTAGLLQLTPALDALRAESGLSGVILDGERFDIGGVLSPTLTLALALTLALT